MSFLWADLLWSLLLIPVLIFLYLWLMKRRQKYALRYASLSLVKEAMGRGPGFRRHVPPVLFLAGLTVMLAALARPAATIMLPSQEMTVVLAIDVSRSMQATDFQPTRLDAAKDAARAFVNSQPRKARIAVVSFSDNAALVQAPTAERQLVLDAIDRLAPQRGTAIGLGILTSMSTIFERPGEKPVPARVDSLGNPLPTTTPAPVEPGSYASAVIVLLTDGQNNVRPAPLDIIEQVADRGVRVYTVGIGTPAGAVLNFGGRSARVLLDENTLKSIARETGARYFYAGTETDLSKIYGTLGTQLVFKPTQTELTAFFTGFAAIVMLVGGILSLLWFRRLP